MAGDKSCANYWGQHSNTSVKRYTNQSNILCGYRPQSLPQMYGVTSAKTQTPTIAILGAYNLANLKNITNEYMNKAGYKALASYTAYPSAAASRPWTSSPRTPSRPRPGSSTTARAAAGSPTC